MSDPNGLGYEVALVDNSLVITIGREFDLTRRKEMWSTAVIGNFRLNYKSVIVDLGKCPVISSTVIAGLVQLHDHYWKTVEDGVIIRHPSAHVLKVLEMMKLRNLFSVESPRS